MLLLEDDSQNARNELVGMHGLSENNRKCHYTSAVNGKGQLYIY